MKDPNAFIKDLKQYVDEASQMQAPKSEHGQEAALAKYDGRMEVLSSIKAILEMYSKPTKPLTLGCVVVITNGPYAEQRGFYQGMAMTPLGPRSEVILEAIDETITVKDGEFEVV